MTGESWDFQHDGDLRVYPEDYNEDVFGTYGTGLSLEDFLDFLADREDEINEAIQGFVEIFCDVDFPIDNHEEFFEDLKNFTGNYLHDRYEIEAFRPMELFDEESGECYYTEYPYADEDD